jgi:bifunctional DNase/RNase
MLEMVIDSIRVSLMNYQRVVILKEKDADRYLPIWIGPAEADAIAVKLQDVSVPRPLTHDLFGSVVTTLGAGIDHIVVSELANDTFYAKIVLANQGSHVEVDCRPSDALAVAVRAKVPIFVDDGVLEKAGIQMDKESALPQRDREGSGAEGSGGNGGQVKEEELNRMSAFKDFISNLHELEELGEDTSSTS